MPLPASKLLDDLPRYYAMIAQLQAKLDAAKKQMETLQTTAHDAAALGKCLDELAWGVTPLVDLMWKLTLQSHVPHMDKTSVIPP